MANWWITAVIAAVLTTPAAAQTVGRFDPRDHKGPRGGAANEVLVLGTTHLSGLPASFDPATLSPLIDRLAAWHPRAIAVEALSGLQCDALRRYPTRYSDTVATYCPDVTTAATATGLDVPAANAAAAALLAAWPKAPAPAQRRRLAALFLAGGERDSALVQWLRLPVGERRAGEGLDAALVAQLEKYRVRRNETSLIAAPLAARLGHERVYAMDDHSADHPDGPDAKAAGEAIMKAWDNPATARRKAIDAAYQAKLGTGEGVLAMYRGMNAPDAAPLIYQSDFGAALEEPSPQKFGRGYLTYWETRNLRMAANIRDMIGDHLGQRAIVIVGASHKQYLDAYLDQMHDVRIADVDAVLR